MAERNITTNTYAAYPNSNATVDVPVISLNSSVSECEYPSTPTTIGFLTRDPIGFDGGAYGIYEYCHTKPHIYMDPHGKQILPFPSIPGGPTVLPPPSFCDSAASAISILFVGDPIGKRYWDHFTGGSGTGITLSNGDCLGVMGSNPLAVQALANAKSTCSQMSGVTGSSVTSETLSPPWKTSLGGVTSSFSYSCDCYCWRWTYSVSDTYDWNSILREWTTHRTIFGQAVTLGFDLAQTMTRCRASGSWKEFPISGVCAGGTCP